jgi:AraC-like DNA-binding protein
MEGKTRERLNNFSELMTCGQNLYYWEYDPALNFISGSCPKPEIAEWFLSLSDCKEYLLRYIETGEKKPLMLSNLYGLSWIAVFEVVAGQLCRVHLLGPAFNSDVSTTKLKVQLRSENFPDAMSEAFLERLSEIPIIRLSAWFQYGLMLHYVVTGEKLTVSDYEYQTKLKDNSFDGDEITNAPKNKAWLAEQMAMQMIEEGRLGWQKAYDGLSEFSSYAAPLGDGESDLRDNKNSVIAMITLSTRAAIRGGLDVETAYYIGEHYIQNVESSATVSEIARLNMTMYEDFINRVHKFRDTGGVSKAIRACCSFIDLHIAEDITLKQLAVEANYSEYYLSQKFKKETGCSVTQYIKQRKIERAKLLLSSSNMSIQDIGESLNFCNNSYFSESFRALTGMSPGEYRAGNTS